MTEELAPKNWQSAAAITLDSIFDLAGISPATSAPDQSARMAMLLPQFDEIVENIFKDKNVESELIEEQFSELAVIAFAAFCAEANITQRAAINEIFDTVVGKQKMYGHGNIARFGLEGIAVRLNDKIERLINLSKHDGPVLFEPLVDTWLDIVGYSLIAIMWIRGWFMLPLKTDKKNTSDI
jgi:hypothetical protein